MTDAEKKIVVDFMKKNGVKIGKNDKGYPNVTCKCGSEMWNNVGKPKKSSKAPELTCKNKGCEFGSKGYPKSVWLDKTKDKVIIDILSFKKAKSEFVVAEKSDPVKKQENVTYDKFGGTIPVSMFTAWAKDMAIYLAEANGVKEHDELDKYFRTCLLNTRETINWFANLADKAQAKDVVVEDVDDLDEKVEEELGEPEDIEDDFEKDVSEDEDYSELDDIEL